MSDIDFLEKITKLIPLTKGKYAIVDDIDYEFLNQWKWHFNGKYAARAQYLGIFNGKKRTKTIYMHRLILNTPECMLTDHINHNKIDNRRSNLRICTSSQNNQNHKPRNWTSSKYKGVYWRKDRSKWCARIYLNYKTINLGCFEIEEDAAIAYNNAAIKYHKGFAKLNIICNLLSHISPPQS